MNKHSIQPIPKLENLPAMMPKENIVQIELEQGVVIFRASGKVRKRIEHLLEESRLGILTTQESEELEAYGEIDDYLSHVNHLIRNSFEMSEVNIAA